MDYVMFFAGVFVLMAFLVMFIIAFSMGSIIMSNLETHIQVRDSLARNFLSATYKYAPYLFLFLIIFWVFVMVAKRERYDVPR